MPRVGGRALLCGFYLNELLLKLLAREDPHPGLFATYEGALRELAAGQEQAPVLRRVYEQMCEPKWVMAFGVCATSGGFYQNYAALQGIDKIIPVDVYVPGCPPRPETVIDAIMKLQDQIANEKHPILTKDF